VLVIHWQYKSHPLSEHALSKHEISALTMQCRTANGTEELALSVSGVVVLCGGA
jgi:hypothetical protein